MIRMLGAVAATGLLGTSMAVDLNEQFEAFKVDFNKTYASVEEQERRISVFAENLERVKKLNANSRTRPFGLTPFMDLTPSEFKSQFGMDANRVAIAKGAPKFSPPLATKKPELIRQPEHKFPKNHVRLNGTSNVAGPDVYWLCGDGGCCSPMQNQGTLRLLPRHFGMIVLFYRLLVKNRILWRLLGICFDRGP